VANFLIISANVIALWLWQSEHLIWLAIGHGLAYFLLRKNYNYIWFLKICNGSLWLKQDILDCVGLCWLALVINFGQYLQAYANAHEHPRRFLSYRIGAVGVIYVFVTGLLLGVPAISHGLNFAQTMMFALAAVASFSIAFRDLKRR
jgi:hypothetical protein